MTASPSASHVVRFGDLKLDRRTGELWQQDGRTVLPPQLLRLLTMLVEARGSMVTREELRQELWADTTFGDFENGLNAAVKRLREALGDSAIAPRFVETIPRRGYRFIAALEDDEPVYHDYVPWYRRRRAVAAAFTLLVAITAIGFVSLSQSGDDPAIHQELVRLTSTSGLNIDPAFSPYGSLLAFASDREGATGLDIWVQPIGGGGGATRITSEEGDEAEPSFSPDGRSIVYAKRERGGIFIV